VKRARFVTEARQEFLAEVAYYNEAQPGLGDRFTKAVEEATVRALTFPLFYRQEGEGIVVFAASHNSRKPRYWVGRTRGR